MWSKRRAALVLSVLAVPGVLGACGRDDGGSDNASAAGDAPIKVMAIAASGSPIQNYPDIEAGGKAAAKAINDAGGIKGRDVEFLFCNDQAEANKSVSCAREAVSEKVAAVVGQVSLFTNQTLPMLEAANIPSIGLMTPGSQIDVQSPAAYPFSSGAFGDYAALPLGMKERGVKKIATAVADLPPALADVPLVQEGTKEAGLEYAGTVKIPPKGVADYAPYAQRVKQLGADALVLVTTPAQTQGLIKAVESIGLDVLYGHHTISFGESEAATLDGAAEGMLISGPTPSYRDESHPGIKEYNEQVKAAGFGEPIMFRTAGINSWLSVYALKEIAERVDGEIDNASIVEALKTAPEIDLKGITTWRPAEQGPKGYERTPVNRMYFQEIKDGKTIAAEGIEPVDVTSLLVAPSSTR
jgi:ABC-type branched-subunit amino acid transport system substrate-binding protein